MRYSPVPISLVYLLFMIFISILFTIGANIPLAGFILVWALGAYICWKLLSTATNSSIDMLNRVASGIMLVLLLLVVGAQVAWVFGLFVDFSSSTY